ncbi:hypothetical protein NPIL_434981 [Nephila pilipes]|uniref:Integrase zinc-binding domain-containing protein n=1 Tax=Nephila pilipes TaxID=299642 RepID=A0A8X6UIA8_NEPPI|nr:hypothetical protein NPIL_434981 [Nephila pilipes]
MNFLEILGHAANREEMTDEEDPDLIQLDTNFASTILNLEKNAKNVYSHACLKKKIWKTKFLKLEKVPVFGSSCDIFYDSSTKKKRPYIPESFRKIVFNSVHNLAHPGIKATTKLLKSKQAQTMFFPDISSETDCALNHKSNPVDKPTSPVKKKIRFAPLPIAPSTRFTRRGREVKLPYRYQ